MKVRAIEDSLENAPDYLLDIGYTRESQLRITRDKEYEVHALAVWDNGNVIVCIICDVDRIIWLPSWVFTVIDPSIPADWQCNLFREYVRMVLGPSFISESFDSYRHMIDKDRDQREKFWARVKRMDETE